MYAMTAAFTDEERDVGRGQRNRDLGESVVVDLNEAEARASSHKEAKDGTDDCLEEELRNDTLS